MKLALITITRARPVYACPRQCHGFADSYPSFGGFLLFLSFSVSILKRVRRAKLGNPSVSFSHVYKGGGHVYRGFKTSRGVKCITCHGKRTSTSTCEGAKQRRERVPQITRFMKLEHRILGSFFECD